MLDRIERVNYFLIPLDPRHEWYRYHHLFGDLLRHELERRQPGRAAELHRRAGRWFLDAGMVSEAIGHLTAAGELDAASELIDNHWLAFTNAGQRKTVARWMAHLPRGYIAGDGRLCLVQARTALTVGERAEVLRWVDLATQAPRNNPGDDAELGEELTVVRAAAWQLLGDMRQAEQLAGRLAPLDGSSIWHSLAACVLGTSARFLDAPDDAQALFETALELGGSRNFIVSTLSLGRLALIAADRGDWRGCRAKIEAAFDVVRGNGLEEYWICTSAHIARGRLFRHNRRPTEARAELERAVGLARRGAGLVEWSYALTTLAELLRELGDRRAARELVLEARELLSRCPEPGTLAPRLVAQLESALRLVVDVSGARPVVIDELTAREQTVLGLLPTGLSAREIGDELGISRAEHPSRRTPSASTRSWVCQADAAPSPAAETWDCSSRASPTQKPEVLRLSRRPARRCTACWVVFVLSAGSRSCARGLGRGDLGRVYRHLDRRSRNLAGLWHRDRECAARRDRLRRPLLRPGDVDHRRAPQPTRLSA